MRVLKLLVYERSRTDGERREIEVRTQRGRKDELELTARDVRLAEAGFE